MEWKGKISGSTLLLWAFGLAWSCLFLFGSEFWLTHFHERDLLRARDMLAGSWEFWGPETNAGPRLPGPFYYFLLAIPIALTGHWQSTIPFLSLLFAGGLVFLTTGVRKVSGLGAAVICGLALGLNPLLTNEMVKNWNPSFSICWMFLILGISLRAQADNPKAWHWVLLGALLSTGLQMHGSFGVLYLAVAWTILRNPPAGISRKTCGAGFLLGVLAPLGPSIVVIFTESAPLSGGGLASWAVLAEYLVSLLEEKISAKYYYQLAASLVPPLFLLVLGGIAGDGEKAKDQRRRAERMLTSFTVVLAPSAFLFFWGGYGERYATLFFCAALTRISMGLGGVFMTPARCALLSAYVLYLVRVRAITGPPASSRVIEHASFCLSFALAALVSYWLVRAGEWRRAGIAAVFSLALAYLPGFLPLEKSRMFNPPLGEVSEITRLIRQKTGWNYLEFRWRTMTVGINSQVGFRIPYEVAMKELPAVPVSDATGLFLVSNARKPLEKERLLQKMLASLESDHLLANVSPNISEAVCTASRALCAFFYSVKGEKKHILFHNLGVTFQNEEVPYREELNDIRGPGATVVSPRPGLVLFSWNNCGDTAVKCRTAIVAELAAEPGPSQFLVTVIGDVLSRSDRAMSPLWAEEWQQPFLAVRCRGGEEFREIISKVGSASKTLGKRYLAPFQRRITFSCPAGQISEVSAGWKSSAVYRLRSKVPAPLLGPSALSWRP